MRKRIFAWILTFAVVTVIILNGISLALIKAESRYFNIHRLLDLSRQISSVYTDDGYTQQMLDSAASAGGIDIAVFDTEGNQLRFSGKQHLYDSYTPEITEAAAGREGTSIRRDYKKVERAYAATLSPDGTRIVRVAEAVSMFDDAAYSSWRYIPMASLILLFAAVILADLLGRRLEKPIYDIAHAAGDIARGELKSRITVKASGELGVLVDSFNRMASRLQSTIDDLWNQYARLEATLAAMFNGVVAVDKQKRLVMINDVARQLFNISTDQLNSNLFSIMECKPMDNLMTAAIVRGGTRVEEMTLGDRIMLLTVSPILRNREPITTVNEDLRRSGFSYGTYSGNETVGALAVLQDITELRRLEQMRSEFVANVSHELRTPLTSIKGFIETMQQTNIPEEKRQHFYDIIYSEAERLDRLIDDILTLSRLENNNGDNSTELRRIDFNPIVEDVIEMLTNKAKLKDIALTYEGTENVILLAQEDQLKQIALNLIDNAIKYNNKGGRVDVKLGIINGRVVFTVADNGIGIPKEQQPRIFERFYRVDKGRSRDMGGTGLGLAIVKHLVSSMHGQVTLESEFGEGTTFKVVLPAIYEFSNMG